MPLPRMRCSLRYLPGSRNKWKRKQNGPESIGTILLYRIMAKRKKNKPENLSKVTQKLELRRKMC